MPTINDVAKHAQTSISSVSRVLNNSGYVREEVRRRVLKAVEELQYNPNALARGLIKNKSNTIGLILPDILNPFFAHVARGVEDTARSYGYNVFLCNTDGSIEIENQYLKVLEQKRVDGIIYAASQRGSQLIAKLKDKGTPLVVLDRQIECVDIDTVHINNYQGAYMAVNYLVSLGHRKIAFIGGPKDIQSAVNRENGYREALQAHGLVIDEDLIKYGDFRYEGGYEGAGMLLAGKKAFSALFSANDMMAIGAINRFVEAGIKVPDDISIVGFDDIPFAKLIVPQLTTIAQPIQDMSRIAAELLLEQIEGEKKSSREVILLPKLVKRKTCKEV
ncbi:MAG: LacI family DNA-binding transcriptional regulator [Bacillota bacterium]